MTQKLYWDNPYAVEFTAKVSSIQKGGVILDKTLFFPTSGNQVCDRGILYGDDIQTTVDYVEITNDNIIHYTSPEFLKKVKIGDEIIGKIDWKYRYGIMKAHTSQHIISAIFLDLYNAKTVRANIEFENAQIQLDQQITDTQMIEAFKKINAICISSSKEITAERFSKEEIFKIERLIRSEIPEKEELRVIKINDLDLVCCGGTHVKKLIEIGPVIITDFKKGTDLKYIVGKKAVDLISNLNIDLVNLSNELNTGLDKVTAKIQSILKEHEENKVLINSLKTDNLKLTSRCPSSVYKGFNIFLFEYQIDSKILKKVVDEFPSDSLLFIQLGQNHYQIVSFSKKANANGIVQGLIKKYGGKGGGSNFTAQTNLDNDIIDPIIELRDFLDSI